MTNAWDTVDLLILTDLPDRLDDRTLALVEAIAALPAPPMIPVPEQRFNQAMRTLTCLPGREDDALTVKLRLALYRRHFGHYPEDAWAFLVEHATLECRFFPTPSECSSILARWSRQDGPHRAHQLARRAAAVERERRFDDLMARFRDGQVSQPEVDALPERWRRIAAVRGYLREDGTYRLRRVPGGESREGEAPADLQDQHTGPREKTHEPHERTGP